MVKFKAEVNDACMVQGVNQQAEYRNILRAYTLQYSIDVTKFFPVHESMKSSMSTRQCLGRPPAVTLSNLPTLRLLIKKSI